MYHSSIFGVVMKYTYHIVGTNFWFGRIFSSDTYVDPIIVSSESCAERGAQFTEPFRNISRRVKPGISVT